MNTLKRNLGVWLIMAIVSMVVLLTNGSVQAASYNTITVDGNSGDWAADEIFTEIAGSFTDFRITWDENNLFFGFNGGGASDKYVVAIDIDPGALNSGIGGPWAGQNFPGYGRPDYIVEFNGADNTVYASAPINAANIARARSGSFLELGIPRSELGALSTTAGFGVYMFATDSSNNIFAFLGGTNLGNPASGTGQTPVTQFYFPTNDDGRSPNSYARYQSHIFSGKTVSPNNDAQFHDIILDQGTLVAPSAGIINVARDFRNNTGSTFTLNDSTVIFNGVAQNIFGTINQANFHNLEIASGSTLTHPGGVGISPGTIVIFSNFTNNGVYSQNPERTTRFFNAGAKTISGSGSTQFGVLQVQTSVIANADGHNFNVSGASITVAGTLNATNNTVTFNRSGTTELAGAGNFNFHNIVINSGATVQGRSALGDRTWRVSGNWTNNGAFTANPDPNPDTVVFNGSSPQTIGGLSNTTFANLQVAANAVVAIPAGTGAASLVNNGTIWQSQDVTGASPVTFLGLGSYGGVIINANGEDLDETTVTIRGNQQCDTANELIHRCFDIDAEQSAGRDATVTFFWNSGELNGNICADLNAFHWSGSGWGAPLTLDGTYGVGGRDCAGAPQSLRVTGVTDFSPFGMTDVATPTAVTLASLSVGAGGLNGWGLWLGLALLSMALFTTALIMRQRQQARRAEITAD